MYSGIHSIMPLEDFPRPNLVGDPCLVLTTDPKPRLRWTAEFHERFVDAVTQLGGPDKATPKMIMRTMGVKGLTLYHLKSHLQKYRMGKQSCKEFSDNSKEVSCIAESQDMGSSTSSSTRMMPQDLNDGFEVIEALRVQMEIQRILHEQLENFCTGSRSNFGFSAATGALPFFILLISEKSSFVIANSWVPTPLRTIVIVSQIK
ncbi:protein PHR1-LIKE 3 isoform X3 [Helianthus annuus]|uniref:protein PHR1-LIKE 3 isoform X3 n=1 Tax=Helianthus annuus TaxID=4232 RepID=UPI000B9048DE|nr:protein PHR1-LIKE 3 isoform X3 [Helianthus annuus]